MHSANQPVERTANRRRSLAPLAGQEHDMISQNVAFAGEEPPHDDDDWALGHSLVIRLRDALVAGGWEVSEPDGWRGSGWSLDCSLAGETLVIRLGSANGGEWMLQIVPRELPGWLGKRWGKVPSATPNRCYDLATAVHRCLTEQRFSSFRWCWDGDPWSSETTRKPSTPTGAS